MSETTQELLDRVLSLPVDDRRDFVDRVIASLDEEPPRLHPAWGPELRRRVAEIDAGEAELIPIEEALRELREICGVREAERAP